MPNVPEVPNDTKVVKIRLYDPTYERDGIMYLVPEWMDWDELPFVEPFMCYCREDHTLCNVDCPVTVCPICLESWGYDHQVELSD